MRGKKMVRNMMGKNMRRRLEESKMRRQVENKRWLKRSTRMGLSMMVRLEGNKKMGPSRKERLVECTLR